MSPTADETSQPPRNDAEITNNAITWSDKFCDFFSTLGRYYPGYAAFEYGIEWMSPEEKENSMKDEEGAKKMQGKK